MLRRHGIKEFSREREIGREKTKNSIYLPEGGGAFHLDDPDTSLYISEDRICCEQSKYAMWETIGVEYAGPKKFDGYPDILFKMYTVARNVPYQLFERRPPATLKTDQLRLGKAIDMPTRSTTAVKKKFGSHSDKN